MDSRTVTIDKARMEKELKTLISGKLKQIRKDSGHSIEKMAVEIGLDYSSFYKVYSGKNLPRLVTLFQISHVYGIPVEFWFKTLQKYTSNEKENVEQKIREFDILQVFDKLDVNISEVILKLLKGYLRKREIKG